MKPKILKPPPNLTLLKEWTLKDLWEFGMILLLFLTQYKKGVNALNLWIPSRANLLLNLLSHASFWERTSHPRVKQLLLLMGMETGLIGMGQFLLLTG